MTAPRLHSLLAISETVHRMTIGFTTQADDHRVSHPGLLRQARLAVVHGTPNDGDENDRKVHAKPVVSKPPMPEHVWLTIMEVEAQISVIASEIGAVVRSDPEATLRSIVGSCGTMEDEDLARLDRDLAGLRRRLELALSWEQHDRNLRGSVCPECETKSTLFVQLDNHGPIGAYCSNCSMKWDRASLEDLARHVNKEDAQ